ncbi:N-acetyltransferase 10 [Desmophyllum pertusum]|uniref:N-acetyltransferase 10 n=1 Tax=Desmophyllum pertusum TaxID=174260 RepID=A0A9X0CHH5_9CNID|nr:N-acetyltransferase 10 [Desmophyllum pertusum]
MGVQKKQDHWLLLWATKGKDQVVILHHMLSKATVRARPSVLWCYKKELGFSSHRKKRMKQLQKKIKSGTLDLKRDDPLELFIAATNIRYCYYAETHKILGNTYGMCVLQDFEALTPNLLARTVETVEGGGFDCSSAQNSVLSETALYNGNGLCQCLVIITLYYSVLPYNSTVEPPCAPPPDVHSRVQNKESHQDVVGRFNDKILKHVCHFTKPRKFTTRLFEFVFKGFDALEFQEHLDYELVQSTNPEFNKAVVRVNIFQGNTDKQSSRFIPIRCPQTWSCGVSGSSMKAAAIPLHHLSKISWYHTLYFLSSTVNGIRLRNMKEPADRTLLETNPATERNRVVQRSGPPTKGTALASAWPAAFMR